jgi:hypothetical protein
MSLSGLGRQAGMPLFEDELDRMRRLWSKVTARKQQPDVALETDRARSKGSLKQMIAAYAARVPDWDGMEGTAPRPDAIADALTIIDELPDEVPVPDKVYAPGDGEVMFQWLRPKTLIEIAFYGDDTISWYARIPGEPVSHGDEPFDRRISRTVPKRLADALHSLA